MRVLNDEEIKRIFLEHFAKQYGEEAAEELLEQLPDCKSEIYLDSEEPFFINSSNFIRQYPVKVRPKFLASISSNFLSFSSILI